MALDNSKIVPAAFWLAFLALGFATSIGGPDKRHARAPKATMVAETEKPAARPAPAATQD
jgi:hypothetical protein